MKKIHKWIEYVPTAYMRKAITVMKQTIYTIPQFNFDFWNENKIIPSAKMEYTTKCSGQPAMHKILGTYHSF